MVLCCAGIDEGSLPGGHDVPSSARIVAEESSLSMADRERRTELALYDFDRKPICLQLRRGHAGGGPRWVGQASDRVLPKGDGPDGGRCQAVRSPAAFPAFQALTPGRADRT